uniref:Uncharacterized protein n=1 Tax=Anguilla anguilla TaxID=7936 RepID=A0A0E9U2D3_ANGAN
MNLNAFYVKARTCYRVPICCHYNLFSGRFYLTILS